MPRIYGIQFDLAWEDKAENHRIVESLLCEQRPDAGSLVVLPEMFDAGFTLNTETMSDEATSGLSENWCAQIARKYGIYLQGASIRKLDGEDDKATNNAVVFDPDGRLVCRYEKVFPFSGGNEPKKYRGGNAIDVFDWQGMTVCPLICYDLRFPELWRIGCVQFGAELFTCGASWPAARQQHWLTLLTARAIENQAFVIGVNRCGSDPYLDYAGGSKIVDALGRTLDEAADQPRIVSAEIDVGQVHEWRARFGAVRDVRPELLGSIPPQTEARRRGI